MKEKYQTSKIRDIKEHETGEKKRGNINFVVRQLRDMLLLLIGHDEMMDGGMNYGVKMQVYYCWIRFDWEGEAKSRKEIKIETDKMV